MTPVKPLAVSEVGTGWCVGVLVLQQAAQNKPSRAQSVDRYEAATSSFPLTVICCHGQNSDVVEVCMHDTMFVQIISYIQEK